MKIKLNIHNNYKIIALIALAIGAVLSYYEISQLFDEDIIIPDSADYFIAISNFIFFTLLSGILIYINTRTLNKHEDLRHFIYSALAVATFSLYIWLVHDPVADRSNERHSEIYDDYYRHRKKERRERGKHSLYFHEKGEDWMGVSVILLFAIYGFSRIYNMSRRKEEIERKLEQLKNESLQSQISALNNQINPHFFFNALNALHSLIVEDKKEKSLEYVSNLSHVFRYILQSEKKDLVNLSEEFAFLETYRFMLSVKYEQKLNFNIQVDKKYDNYFLPVLSLLPIVENVIKHNEISNKHPMTVDIYIDGNDYLIIKNEKREKLDRIDSEGIGMKNLNNRFRLLTKKEIKIENTPLVYSVCLPLSMPKQ